MIKKFASLAALGLFLKYIKKDWTYHPFFDAGIIDKDGEKLISKDEMTKDQKDVYNHINIFAYKIKRIIQKNIFLKWSIISALTSAIFLKESKSDYSIGLYEDEYVIVHNDSYHQDHGATEIVTETGPMIVDSKLIDSVNLHEEVTNSIGGVAGYPTPLSPKNKINILKRRQKCKKNQTEPKDQKN